MSNRGGRSGGARGGLPREAVTPTRRDRCDPRDSAAGPSNINWVPVSEYNSRPSQNRTRKPINALPENSEYIDLDYTLSLENSNRFVPVRPQPRTLGLRHRENILENQEESSPNAFLSAHSPHAAVMIVNPTTPNSNQANHMATNVNQPNGSRNVSRSGSANRDNNATFMNNTAPVGPYASGSGSKSNNLICDNQESVHQNCTNHSNHQSSEMMPISRMRAVRAIGESMVSSCPDTSRVEQRLGQIQEYIQVTENLVESMRNSEDELRKRVASLQRRNLLLMEAVYQENNGERSKDIEDLLCSLKDLKESETKLKEMLDSLLKIKDEEELNDNGTVQIEEITEDEVKPKETNVSREKTPENVIIIEDANSAKEVPRSCSVQSGGSAYSDNYLWQAELEAKIEASQYQTAVALHEQKYLLKCQADAKALLDEINVSRMENLENPISHVNGVGGHQEPISQINFNNGHPVSIQSNGRTYSSNQIGVATTLPHISDGIGVRRSMSHDRESIEDFPQGRSKRASTSSASMIQDSEQMDMLRDLQIRRQHIENQVAKIQNLQAATASLSEIVADAQAGLFTSDGNCVQRPLSNWDGSEDSIIEEDPSIVTSTLKSKMAAVNVIKMELDKLKGMLRTVDSIQSNFGLNPMDDDNLYDQAQHVPENHYSNQNRMDESGFSESFNNTPVYKPDGAMNGNIPKANQEKSQTSKNQKSSQNLSRLQNCISSSSKCTNVDDQQHRENMCADLAAIQQITQQMKQEAQEITEERRRLKHALNRDVNDSSGSSIKSDDKKRTNSMNKGQGASKYPPLGPIERKQLALKAELEAKKKQLECLMSKHVNHRTNQQMLHLGESSKSSGLSNDKERDGSSSSPMVLQHAHQSTLSVRSAEDDICTGHVKSEADNGYSSDPDDEEYSSTSNAQININQLNERCAHKLSLPGPSSENYKDYRESSRSSENGSKRGKCSHSNIFTSPSQAKQRNKEPIQIPNPMQDVPIAEGTQDRRPSRDLYSITQRMIPEPVQESKNLAEMCHNQRSNAQDMTSSTQTLSDCLTNLTGSVNAMTQQKKQSSRPDSGSSSGDQRTSVPHPMPPISLRHTILKNEQDQIHDNESQTTWHNPHSESQVAMWWHNKANQLQQQLEMTSNLCQSLLQDRRASHSSLSTLNSLPQAVGNTNMVLPNYNLPQSVPFAPWNNGGNDPLSTSWWAAIQQQQLALQQQQLAAQQQQLSSTSWGNNQCLQHLLAQQREISALKSLISNMEDKLHVLNMSQPRSHSTPPNANIENSHEHQVAGRSNSSLSRSNYQWNHSFHPNQPVNQVDAAPPPPNPFCVPLIANQNNAVKKPPTVPPYPVDHINNFYIPPFSNDHIGIPGMNPNNLIMGNPLFNNAPQINPNLLANHHPIQSNMNATPLLNLSPHLTVPNTHPISVHPVTSVTTQTLSSQNTALNNQVPPGNRANNYWDNFRSYSRQNLLSGTSKVNAECSLQTHSPHPLMERSHNTLHASPTPIAPQVQSLNTPKRNVNNQLGNNVTLNQLHHNPNLQTDALNENARGRRNLSNEAVSHAPPDVLNIHQNIDSAILDDNSINLNINPATSHNLNLSRSNGAMKKKSSSKLPSKNTSNAVKYSMSYNQNKNVQSTAPESDSNTQKSMLFDLLRENVYSEVSALISANKSRPHFLIQLFRDLQQISSDPLRQRTLQSIQELVTHYLNGDQELYRSQERVSSTSVDFVLPNGDLGLFSLDTNNEILKFFIAHKDEPCTNDLLKSLRDVIVSIAGSGIDQAQLDQCLADCFSKHPDKKLMDISDEFAIALSKISIDKPVRLIVDDSREEACGISDVKSQECESEAILDEYLSCSMSSSSRHDEPLDVAAGCSHHSAELKIDLIENVESCNGDLAEADQSRNGDEGAASLAGGFDGSLPDIVDMDEQTPTEAEAEWLRLDRVPTRLETEDCPGNQSDPN